MEGKILYRVELTNGLSGELEMYTIVRTGQHVFIEYVDEFGYTQLSRGDVTRIIDEQLMG